LKSPAVVIRPLVCATTSANSAAIASNACGLTANKMTDVSKAQQLDYLLPEHRIAAPKHLALLLGFAYYDF